MLATSFAAAATLLLAPPRAMADTVVIKVDKVHTGMGEPVDGPIVLVDGKIARIGGDIPDGARVLDHSGSIACAGFVDATTQLGGRTAYDEPARALTPGVLARAAFDPFHDDFDEAVHGGVTTVGLSPNPVNLISGVLAIARTRGAGEDAVLVGDGPLRMALSRSALQPTRAPTSRMGALHVLRSQVSDLPGGGPIVVEANSDDEVRVVLSLLKDTGRKVVVSGASTADEVVTYFQEAGAMALFGALGPASSTRNLRAPGLLSGAGVEVAFTARGNGAALRATAALAVRSGMDPAAALAAITSVPAAMLGATDCGSLRPGARGDVLIFDGHPLDLSATLRAVYCAGRAVDIDD